MPSAPTSSVGNIARAAHHESSHGVVAHRCGVTVRRLAVRNDGSGIAEYPPFGDDAPSSFVAAQVALAGIFSELFMGVDDAARAQLAHCYDLLNARMLIDRYRALGEPLGPVSNRTFAIFAGCVVVSNWPTIQRIAYLLEAERELAGDVIAALCGCAQ